MKYIIEFGASERNYYTRYHAEQMCRALRLNGTPFNLTKVRRDSRMSLPAR